MSIYKAYDIRGTLPDEINEGIALQIASYFTHWLSSQNKNPITTMIVGRDNRASSDVLLPAVIEGITKRGINVIDIGLCATPAFYFAVQHFNANGGIMITASHNPPQYNGFKLVREQAIPVGGETGIKDVERMVTANEALPMLENTGSVTNHDISDEYIKANTNDIPVANCSALKVVVDTGNGVSVRMAEPFFKTLPCTLIPLFFELDGSFPNHMPDPLKPENVKALQAKVVETGATMGVAFDADGDRVFFIDEQGKTIASDLITALIAKELLSQGNGAGIMYDLRSSWIVKETIEQLGGKAIMSRVGHAFIKAQMRKEDALFAGELSGHFYFKNMGFVEAPLLVVTMIINALVRTNQPLSKLIEPFKTYFQTGEVNFSVADKQVVLNRLQKKYSDALNAFELDGRSFEYADWWCNVRASNTEPLLRLNLEAKTKELRDERFAEVKALIEE